MCNFLYWASPSVRRHLINIYGKRVQSQGFLSTTTAAIGPNYKQIQNMTLSIKQKVF